MNMDFKRKLPIPKDIKEMFPISEEYQAKRDACDKEIKAILDGSDDRLLMVIGPCSADNEEAVLDYLLRLRKVQDKVKDKICIIPRVYTSKPRTTGKGYKGMLHQPDPLLGEDMLKGIITIRETYIRTMKETDFFCADELLYPENYRYLSDILCYVAIGARSVENQFHRLTASGLDIAVGMKNPTGGDLSVLMNSLIAAQTHFHLQKLGGCQPRESVCARDSQRTYEQTRTVDSELSLRRLKTRLRYVSRKRAEKSCDYG